MNPVFIYALIFVAALLLVDGLLRLLMGARRASTDVTNRLEGLKQRKGSGAYTEMLQRRGFAAQGGTSFTFGWLSRLYRQSGLELPMSRRLFYLAALFLAGWLIATMFISRQAVIQLPFALAFMVVTAIGIVFFVRRKRIRRFVDQLPTAIEIMVRSLNAGHPVTAAINLVAKEMPDPVGSEFGMLTDQLTFGSEIEDGMMNMIDRTGVEEIKLLAVTITVQRGTGGNLSEILENLAGMIRDRAMIKAKIKAISAEGRITAVIMAVFPFLLFLMILTLAPTYFDEVWASGWAGTIIAVCLVIMAIGVVILHRLVNFDF